MVTDSAPVFRFSAWFKSAKTLTVQLWHSAAQKPSSVRPFCREWPVLARADSVCVIGARLSLTATGATEQVLTFRPCRIAVPGGPSSRLPDRTACRTLPYLMRERSYGPSKWPNGRLWPAAARKPSLVRPFGPRRTCFGTCRFRPSNRRWAISDGHGATAKFLPARATVSRLRRTLCRD